MKQNCHRQCQFLNISSRSEWLWKSLVVVVHICQFVLRHVLCPVRGRCVYANVFSFAAQTARNNTKALCLLTLTEGTAAVEQIWGLVPKKKKKRLKCYPLYVCHSFSTEPCSDCGVSRWIGETANVLSNCCCRQIREQPPALTFKTGWDSIKSLNVESPV